MVRLVFRPFTQFSTSICTLERLRTSTWLSSGFIPITRSSPSFGSAHIRFYSNLSKKSRSVDDALLNQRIDYRSHLTLSNKVLYFHYAYIEYWFATIILAHMFDSLVRVPRRDINYRFFVNLSTSWSCCEWTTLEMTLNDQHNTALRQSNIVI